MSEQPPTRVLLVDDHDLIRDGLAGVFRLEPSMRVLGDAKTVTSALEMFHELPNPDKQLIVLAGTAHNLGLSYNRNMFWHAAHSFLTMPPMIVSV